MALISWVPKVFISTNGRRISTLQSTFILVWVRLPNLLVHCWNWDSLKHISNGLGKFIDRENKKDQYDCAQNCVEVDLEVGLLEAIKIKVGS